MITFIALAGVLSTPANFWVEGAYSNEVLDIFDYSEKVSSSTDFKDERSLRLGARWQVKDTLSWFADYTSRNIRAEREREPFNVDLKHQNLQLGLEWWNETPAITPAWQVAIRLGKFPKQHLERYQIGNRVLGKDIVFSDPVTLEPYPLHEFSMQTYGFSLSHSRSLEFADLYWQTSYEYTYVDISVNSVIDKITDPELLNINFEGRSVKDWLQHISNKMPQANPWHEHNLSLGLQHNLQLSSKWSLDNNLIAYGVFLDGYETKEGNSQFNLTLNSTLTHRLNKNLHIYGSVYLGSNYTLGLHPGTYTQQSSFMFDHPYMLMKLGASFYWK